MSHISMQMNLSLLWVLLCRAKGNPARVILMTAVNRIKSEFLYSLLHNNWTMVFEMAVNRFPNNETTSNPTEERKPFHLCNHGLGMMGKCHSSGVLIKL